MSKDTERVHFRRFQDSFAECPQGDGCEDERPDFLLRASNGLLGIEHTQIFEAGPAVGPPRQVAESWWRDIVDEARALYETSNDGRLDVAVMFQAQARLNHKRVKELAVTIADFARSADFSVGHTVRFTCTETNYRTFPPEINHLRVSHFGPDVVGCWTVQDAAYIGTCTTDLLQARLAEKEERLPVYRRKCSEVWLLVVLDGFQLSSSLQVPDETVAHRYSSCFDCVFLFDSFKCRTWTLTLDGKP